MPGGLRLSPYAQPGPPVDPDSLEAWQAATEKAGYPDAVRGPGAQFDPAVTAKAAGGPDMPIMGSGPGMGLGESGPPPPGQPEVGQAPIDTNPGVPGSSEGNRDTTEGTAAMFAARQMFAPYVQSSVRPQTILGEGEDPYTFGGLEGRENYQQAAKVRPGQVEESLASLGQTEEDYGKAKYATIGDLQRFQAEELAVLRQRQLERNSETASKQKQVDEAVKRYSDDLADTGKFWRNPGNIISAIGAAMMVMGSHDKSIGIRLVNQAVQADWAHRKSLADMHLGELRSNMAAYRQIAGDADVGDRMALNESYRIAAMEVDRVGAQFQGKIAKEKSKALSAELMQKYAQNAGALYNQYLYNKPRVENPLIKKNYEASGGYQAFAPAGAVGGRPGPAVAAASSKTANAAQRNGGVGQNQGVKGGQASGTSSGDSSGTGSAPHWRNTAKGVSIVEGREPGLMDQTELVRHETINRIAAKVGLYGRIDPSWSDEKINSAVNAMGKSEQWNSGKAEVDREHDKEMHELSPRMQPIASRMELYRNFGKRMQELNVISSKLGVPPDELIGTRAEMLTPDGILKKYREWKSSGRAEGKSELREQEINQLTNRFRQTLNQAVNMYTHDMYAGNVSAGEQQMRDKYINQSHSWDTLTGFYNDISASAQAEATNALVGASPAASVLWRARVGQNTKVLSFSGTPGFVRQEQNMTKSDPKEETRRKAIETLKGGSGVSPLDKR